MAEELKFLNHPGITFNFELLTFYLCPNQDTLHNGHQGLLPAPL
jgi:hypothetical protein